MLISRLDSRDINLLPLDRYVIGLKDGLDGFGNLSTNTVAYVLESVGLMEERGMKPNCLPGMSVVVYFPPNLVGLKISDCTVAMAGGDVSQE